MPSGQNEKSLELQFPVGGLDLSVGHDKQPPGTTPVGENVRAFEPRTQRARGGSRCGLLANGDRLPSGSHLIQHLAAVVVVDSLALLDEYDWVDGEEDWSSGRRGRGRMIRPGGSGRRRSSKRRKTPRIRWATPAAIEEGTAIGATQLNAHIQDPAADASGTSDLDFNDGTFRYTIGAALAGTGSITLGVWNPIVSQNLVLPQGRYAIKVVYTPTELTDSVRSATKTVRINIVPSGSGVETFTFVGLVTGGGGAINSCVCDVTATGSLGTINSFSYEVIAPGPPPFEPGGNFLVGNTYNLNATDNTNPFGGTLTFA